MDAYYSPKTKTTPLLLLLLLLPDERVGGEVVPEVARGAEYAFRQLVVGLVD